MSRIIRHRMVGDIPVFYCIRRFGSAYQAGEVWKEIERKLAGKDLDLGIYRHGTSKHPACLVTVLSISPVGVEKAEKLMRGGVDVDLADDGDVSYDELDALIMRRVHAVMSAPPGATHEEWHYGSGGKRLHPDGTYD